MLCEQIAQFIPYSLDVKETLTELQRLLYLWKPFSITNYNIPFPSKGNYSLEKPPSMPSLSLSNYDINKSITIRNIAIPPNTLNIQLSFSPSNKDIPSINFPQPLTEESLPPITYPVSKIGEYLYHYILFPVSIQFPQLLHLSDVNISDFSFDIDFSPSEPLLSIDSSKYTFELKPTVNDFIYTVRGKFLSLNNYKPPVSSQNLLSSFNRELSYFQSLIQDMLVAQENILNIDYFVLQIDSLLSKENTSSFKHLSDKEIALIKTELLVRIYSEILKSKINRLETIVNTVRDRVLMQINYNKELLSLWVSKQEYFTNAYRTYIDFVKKNSTLYNMYSDVNKSLRDLFYFYNSLTQHVIESIVLNIERERIVLSHQVAKMKYDTAKLREEIPPHKINLLHQLVHNISARYDALVAEYESLPVRLQAILAKQEANNANLLANKIDVEAMSKKFDIQGKKMEIDTDLKLFERINDNFIKMIEEYYSIQNKLLNSYFDKRRLSMGRDALEEQIKGLNFSLNAIAQTSTLLSHTYQAFFNLHRAASHMIARANLKSTIIETYE